MTALTAPDWRVRVRRSAPAVLGALFSAGAIALAFWLAERPQVSGLGPDYQRMSRGGTVAQSAGIVGGAALAPLKGQPQAAPADTLPPPIYSLHIGTTATPAGAILLLQQLGKNVPDGTYIPTTVNGHVEYMVYAGAFTSRSAAEAYLHDLDSRGVLRNAGLNPTLVIRNGRSN